MRMWYVWNSNTYWNEYTHWNRQHRFIIIWKRFSPFRISLSSYINPYCWTCPQFHFIYFSVSPATAACGIVTHTLIAFVPLEHFKIQVFEYHRAVHAIFISTCKLHDFWLANNTIKHNIIKRPFCAHEQCVYVPVIFKRNECSGKNLNKYQMKWVNLGWTLPQNIRFSKVFRGTHEQNDAS